MKPQSSSPEFNAAKKVLQERWPKRPRFGIILGTGAGDVANRISADVEIPYSEIPGFPTSTAVGHKGQFVCGQLEGTDIIAMQGRFHLYEGYSNQQVRLPLELMRSQGVELLFISNAAGGINPKFQSGQLMALNSHLDLMFRSWQVPGHTFDPEAFPAGRPTTRADVYDRDLIHSCRSFARKQDFVLQQGVYAGLLGPTYETRAEYRFLRKIGADVAGMSTVPEVVFAAELGMKVMAFSIVANIANPDQLEPTSGQEVVDAAAVAAPRLCSLVTHAMQQWQ